jgi:hypothetical protein
LAAWRFKVTRLRSSDPQEILLGELHLALGLLFSALELGDACGFLDEQAPVLRTSADNQPNLPLLDDRVRLGARAGTKKKIGDISQSYRGFVDEILTLPGSIQAARHGKLGVVPVLDRHLMRRVIVERKGDLGEIVGRSRFASAENYVLHRTSAQMTRALLAHAPADRIDDVRFSAAVRADDREDVVVELHDRPVHEGLEADELELLDLHPVTSTCPLPRPLRHGCQAPRDARRPIPNVTAHMVTGSSPVPPFARSEQEHVRRGSVSPQLRSSPARSRAGKLTPPNRGAGGGRILSWVLALSLTEC